MAIRWPFGKKAAAPNNTARPQTSIYGMGQPQWTEWNIEAYYVEGLNNPYLFRAYDLISECCASVNAFPYDANDKDIKDPDLLKFLETPNPYQGRKEWLKEMFLHFLIGGQAFGLSVDTSMANDGSKPPTEIYAFGANKMAVKSPANIGDPLGFVYKPKGTDIDIDPRRVFWFKSVNPRNVFDGLPATQAAGKSVDANNAYLDYIRKLFLNEGVPPSTVSAKEGSVLSSSQRKDIKEMWYAKTGQSLLALDGGVSIQPLGWNPKDMDMKTLYDGNVREIGVALGISPILLGDASQSTYSNYEAARAQLYLEKVLPLLAIFYSAFSRWLTMRWNTPINMKADMDDIEALNVVRQSKWTSLTAAYDSGVLLLNETREQMGFEVVEGGDTFKAPAPSPFDFGSDEESSKALELKKKGGRRVMRPPARNRKAIREAREGMARILERFFDNNKVGMIQPLVNAFEARKSIKADLTEKELEALVEEYLGKMDLDSFKKLPTEVQNYITAAALDGGKEGLAAVRMDGIEELMNLVNEKAVAWAEAHAAELVTMIGDSTRNMIRADVVKALEEGWSADKLKSALMESTGFSKERAMRIARTETAFADMEANRTAYRESGVVKRKVWLLGGNPCELCEENAEQGEIDLEDEWKNGSSPVHPNCVCDEAPVIGE